MKATRSIEARGPRILLPTWLLALAAVAVGTCATSAAWGAEFAGLESACVTEPYKDAVLSLSVAGRIDKILVKEGDKVKKGDPLINLEREVEELEVQRRELIWQDKSELEAATMQAATFKEIVESTRKLFEATKSVSQEELLKLELEYSSAQAAFQRLQIAERREEVEYQLAKANFERRTLSAPFSGTVVDISLQEGESGDPNQPLLQLVDISKGFLVCNVEEPVGRNITQGQTIPVRITAGEGFWEANGKVVFASPLVDSASGLMRLKISFDNPKGEVRPGLPGYIRFGPGT